MANRQPDIGPLEITPGGIMGLDPSKGSFGWAYASPAAVESWPAIAMVKGRGPHEGVSYGCQSWASIPWHQWTLAFPKWWNSMLDRFRPRLVIQEAPVMLPKHNNPARTRVMYGLEFSICSYSMWKGIAWDSAEPKEMKRAFAGHGSAGKADMVARAQWRGYNVAVDDVADALAALEVGILRDQDRARKARAQQRVTEAMQKGR